MLVVGASSGIGAATAVRYARDGARLALAARTPAALADVAARCRAAGAADVLVHPMDVRDRAGCADLVAAAVGRFGALDVVVHSAGVTAFGRFDDIPPEVFDGVVATNLLGAANVVRAVLPSYRERGRGRGSVVLVGSVLGHAAGPRGCRRPPTRRGHSPTRSSTWPRVRGARTAASASATARSCSPTGRCPRCSTP